MLGRVQFQQREEEALMLDAVELLQEARNQQGYGGRSREESAGDTARLTPSKVGFNCARAGIQNGARRATLCRGRGTAVVRSLPNLLG